MNLSLLLQLLSVVRL